VAEVRVDVEVTAKRGPVVPTTDGEAGAASHDAVVNGVEDRDVITAELKLGVG
jgi:hypothetical protein